jgi:ATP-binding cassette subfamily B protein
VRPHRGTLVLGFLLGLGATAVALAQPLAAKAVIDDVEAQTGLAGPVLVLLLLILIGAALSFAQSLLLGRLAERVVLGARMRLVDRMLRLRVTELATRPSGDLVSRVTSDATLLRAAATSSVVDAVNGAIAVVGAVVLMAFIDTVLLGVTLVALGLIVAALTLTLPRAGAARRRSQEAVGNVGAVLDGTLRGIRTVKAANGEARESARVGDAAEDAYTQGTHAVVMSSVARVSAGVGLQAAFLVVLGVGAWRVSEGALDLAGLVAFLLYLLMLGGPVGQLTSSATEMQQGLAAAARMREVEELPAEPAGEGATPGPAPPGTPLVRLRGLVVRYGGPGSPAALDGVDLDLPRRGTTALVGPSGAGKTTLVSTLLRFVDPSEGLAELDGVDLRRWAPHEVRRRVAYVEQDAPLLPGTLAENLRYGAPEASDADLHAVVAAMRLGYLVERLPDGLGASLLGTEISGGERQRIAIARALLRRPELLLLDEVTAQLDARAEAAVTAAVREAAARCAVLTIAHRLSTVVASDRIVVLDGGRVRAVGPHAALMGEDALYRELVQTTLLPLAVASDAPRDGVGAPA